MRSAAVCIAFVLTCTSGSLVAGIRYIDPLGSNGDIGDKRLDLTEPSCDELRAMWRYTKRQSRAAKTTNGYGMYMGDPYNPNIWQRAELPDRPKYSKGRGEDTHLCAFLEVATYLRKVFLKDRKLAFLAFAWIDVIFLFNA